MRSPVPAFRFTGVIPLLWPRLSHSTPDTQFREGSSLQAGLYARTPVQSDYRAMQGNYHLESNPYRHNNSPVAVAIGNLVYERSWSMGLREATLEEQFWFLWSRIPSYLRKKELVALNSGKRTTVGSGGFFVCKARDYDETGIITRRYLQKSRQQITFEQPSYMRKSKDAIINYNQHNPSNIIVIFYHGK